MSEEIKHTSRNEVRRRVKSMPNSEISPVVCAVCGGLCITTYGAGMSRTVCVDCKNEEYDRD